MDRPGSGLRRLIGFLLALNLGVLLAGLASERWSGSPSAPLTFNADKITLLTLAQPVTKTESGAHAGSAAAAAYSGSPSTGQAAAGVSTHCLSWPTLDADGLLAIETWLKRQGVPGSGYEFRLDRRMGWWVYLPPFQDGATLQAAMENIRQKGFSDFSAVRGGRMANALSLGAFPSLAKARAHAAALSDKGIADIRIGPRPQTGEIRLVFSPAITAQTVPALDATWPPGLKPGRCQVVP